MIHHFQQNIHMVRLPSLLFKRPIPTFCSTTRLSPLSHRKELHRTIMSTTTQTPAHLKIYSGMTPNGIKPIIYLSLLNQDYVYHKFTLSKAEQTAEWYTHIHPNNKVPALEDVHSSGKSMKVFESAAVMLYIGEKYDVERKFYYAMDAGDLYYEQLEWVTFQVASYGPYAGEGFFFKMQKEEIPVAKNRYLEQVKRALGVYERRLSENGGWLVGDHCNVADIIAYPFLIKANPWFGLEMEEWPAVKKWLETIEMMPGVKEAYEKA